MALFAAACGRTANTGDTTGNGARTGSGGTGSGGRATGGSSTTSHAGKTGEAGEAAEPGAAGAPAECPVTPIAGRWLALGPDPYGFDLSNDGSHLTGKGCLGGFPEPNGSPLFDCMPLTVLADDGRSFHFMWDAGPGVGAPYIVEMELTLSPERTSLAGKMWSSYAGNVAEEGIDIVLVPYPEEPILPATVCSGGEPSGACFLGPLRSDRFDEPRVSELRGGDLQLLWLNQRGVGKHLGSARFDAAANAWQPAEFLDDGSAPIDSPLFTTTQSWAMVVYRQANALVARAYDSESKAWSKQQVVVAGAKALETERPEALFVYNGGNATLIASSQPLDAASSLSAYDYDATSGAWVSSHQLDASANNATSQWAAGSDTSGRQLVVWVRGGKVNEPFELWFSSRDQAANWTEPALFLASDKQLLRPAVAVAEGGSAFVTWQEWQLGIRSTGYSFSTNTWSEPLLMSSDTQIDNRKLGFNAAGAAVAYLYNYGSFFPYGELKSVLSNAGWSTPQVSSAQEASGATYQVTGANPLQLERLEPRSGEKPIPGLERPRCEGY